MRIFFFGETQYNAGPTNVNKAIVKRLPRNFSYLHSHSKVLRFVEGLVRCIFCRVMVISGVTRQAWLLSSVAKKLGKKVLFIMHGCAEYEVRVNQLKRTKETQCYEDDLLARADLLLPVSKKFMVWVKEYYPHYAGKTDYLFNGVDDIEKVPARSSARRKGVIVAVGGDRATKNNLPVAQAVQALGGRVQLEIYGRIHNEPRPKEMSFVTYQGHLPSEEFFERLASSEIFVLNSIFEPFSLSVMDALRCGCSVLVSECAGVTDLLKLEEQDIIFDPSDSEEIGRKILYLLEHPNAERLLGSVDASACSTEASIRRLEALCYSVVQEWSRSNE